VVALLENPRSPRPLLRFSLLLAAATTLVLLGLAATPLGRFWFAGVSHLDSPLVHLGSRALWLALPLPAFSVFQSWYQGNLVHRGRTRGISEAMGLSLAAMFLVLWAGIGTGTVPGLTVGVAAMSVGAVFQVGWLALRSRPLPPAPPGG
jgi:hypothetical protein